MEKTPINKIILISGYIGYLQGIQRFLLPVALIHYGWDLSQYGTVYIFQALAMVFPMLLAGISTDIKGRKQTIVIGLIFFTLGSLILMYTINGSSLFLIIVAQVITTISFGIIQTGLSILIADETKIGFERTNSLGKQATLKNIASFLGPLFMGIYLDVMNIKLSLDSIKLINLDIIQSGFLVMAIFSILGIFISTFLPFTPQENIDLNKKAKIFDYNQNQRKMYTAFTVEELLIGFTSGMIVPFINYYILTVFKPSDSIWGLVFGLSNSSIAFGSFFVGRYAEKFGKSNTVMVLNIFAPFLALGIAFGAQFWVVSFFYILRAGFANAVTPAWESWFYYHTPETLRGRSLSIIQLTRRLSRAAGTATGPVLFTLLGPALFPIGCLFYPFAMAIPRKAETNLE